MSVSLNDISGTGLLEQEFDLVGDRSRETHYYIVQSELATHSSKGVLKSTDIYREYLKVEPGDRSEGEADHFTCKKFALRRGDDPEVTIPALEGFSYDVNKDLLDMNGIDENGLIWNKIAGAFQLCELSACCHASPQH